MGGLSFTGSGPRRWKARPALPCQNTHSPLDNHRVYVSRRYESALESTPTKPAALHDAAEYAAAAHPVHEQPPIASARCAETCPLLANITEHNTVVGRIVEVFKHPMKVCLLMGVRRTTDFVHMHADEQIGRTEQSQPSRDIVDRLELVAVLHI